MVLSAEPIQGVKDMKWIIFVLLMVACILLVICYALMVMAHDADERAEEIYRKWKEKDDEH